MKLGSYNLAGMSRTESKTKYLSKTEKDKLNTKFSLKYYIYGFKIQLILSQTHTYKGSNEHCIVKEKISILSSLRDEF